MMKQNSLRLSFPRKSGESKWLHNLRNREVNKPTKFFTGTQLLAQMLKRQARRIMADITECPPDTIPAHLARIEDIKELIGHAVRHDFKETRETRLSGAQLSHPSTLADFEACLIYTRDQHRSPAFANSSDEQLNRIEGKIDTLAGLFAGSKAFQAVLLEESEYL